MIVIADTSALVALSICKGLGLLDKLFGTIAVPQTVYDECIVPDKAQSEVLQKYLQNKVKNIDEKHFLQLPVNL